MSGDDDLVLFAKENPLINFSIYTTIQVRILKDHAQQLIDELDRAFGPRTVDGRAFQKIYGLFWLWVLGAYEVVRTMDEAQDCFDKRCHRDIKKTKMKLTELRIPFAKQQLPLRQHVFSGENSVTGIDVDKKDFSFTIMGNKISVRHTIAQTTAFFDQFSVQDVVKRLEDPPSLLSSQN